MRRPAAFVLSLLFALPLPAIPASQAVDSAPKPPVEMRISGPRLIRRGDKLNFHVEMINRSDKPIAVRPQFGYYDATGFEWRITDAGGRVLPAPVYDGPPIFICPVTGPVPDKMITILKPGEKADYSEYVSDPSNSFVFKGKGFYRATLSYRLQQTNNVAVCDLCGQGEPEEYTPQQKVDMLKSMGTFEATSNEWQMYLTE